MCLQYVCACNVSSPHQLQVTDAHGAVVPHAQFEKAENKPAIIGYSAAAVGALFFSEWLIHLPVFNVVSMVQLLTHVSSSKVHIMLIVV
jgi:hypothetical protein